MINFTSSISVPSTPHKRNSTRVNYENGLQPGKNMQRGFDPKKSITVRVTKAADVRVGDVVYLYWGKTLEPLGLVTGLTDDPARPWQIAKGVCPGLSRGCGLGIRFAYAFRVIPPVHPVFGTKRTGDAE